MRATARSVIIALVVLGLGAATALAGEGKGTDKRTDHQSACGAAHGAFANENGNFGFLGEVGGTPGYHNGATGQDPGATGSNNSSSTCNDA